MKKRLLMRTTAALLATVASAVHAQQAIPSPGQLVPKPDDSPRLPAVAPPSPLPSPALAPPGAADVVVTLGQVELDGDVIDGVPAVQDVLASLRGRTVRVSDVYDAASRIERAYVEQGWFLTRVVVPPQQFAQGGVLRLQVVAGRIESVDVSAVPPRRRERVAELLRRLVEQAPLSRHEFERRLLLAAGLPGLALTSALMPGERPGRVRLVVEGIDRGVESQLSLDNALPPALGRTSAQLSASGSMSGDRDESWGLLGAAVDRLLGPGSSPRQIVEGGTLVGIGDDGDQVGASLVLSDTRPSLPAWELQTRSDFSRYSLKQRSVPVLSRTDAATSQFSFDVQQERQVATQFGVPLYDDRLSIIRWAGSWLHQGPDTSMQLGVDLARGVHALGSRGHAQATSADPVSQGGASDVFFKAEEHLVLQGAPAPGWWSTLSARAQQTPAPLMASEKFVAGGPDDVSAYDSGAFSGDRGWQWRAELERRTGSLRAYIFAAHVRTWTLQATSAERSRASASAVGVGVRLRVGGGGIGAGPVGVNLEFAGRPAARASDGAGAQAFNVSVVTAF